MDRIYARKKRYVAKIFDHDAVNTTVGKCLGISHDDSLNPAPDIGKTSLHFAARRPRQRRQMDHSDYWQFSRKNLLYSVQLVRHRLHEFHPGLVCLRASDYDFTTIHCWS